MAYHYYTPQPSLQPDVKWFCAIEVDQAVFNQRIFLADPYPGLVINFGSPLLFTAENGNQVELPRAVLMSLQTKPINVQATGVFRCIGVCLDSWGGRFLVDKQADLAAPFVPLGREWQDLAGSLQQTFDQQGEVAAIAELEQIVSDHHQRRSTDVTPVRTAIELLRTTNGQYGINELAECCYLSRSQLERRFNYLTGVSPKMLSRLVRFRAVCDNLVIDSSQRLTDLAHKFGYVDQAHFIHEFAALTGSTPRNYLVQWRKLSIDASFLQSSTI